MIFGPYIHYEPNSSLFTNLFDIRRADPVEHFSRLFLLDYCNRHAHSVDKYGFIPLTTIHSYMTHLGYSGDHIADVVNVLFAKKCLEGKDYEDEAPTLGDNLRITSLGRYHVATLVRLFTYLDAVVVDTPILDEKTRQSMNDIQPIESRLERAREFLRYLDKCAQSLADVEAQRVWADVSQALANDITDIEQTVQAAKARRGLTR